MPITVRHGDVAQVGKLAVTAGRAQGQAIQAARRASLSQASAARRERRLETTQRITASNRQYALQQAGAQQIARDRPTDQDFTVSRRTLLRTVDEAAKAGIYAPEQISQARIFASINDKASVRSILLKLPKPKDVSQAEIRRRQQLQFFGGLIKETTTAYQTQINDLDRQLPYGPDTLEFLRKNPQHMPEDRKPVLAARDALVERRDKFLQDANLQKRQLQWTLMMPTKFGEKPKLDQEATARLKLLQGKEQELRRQLQSQIGQLQRTQKIDPYKDALEEQARVNKLSDEITDLQTQIDRSHERDEQALQEIFRTPTDEAGPRIMATDDELDQALLITGGDEDAALQLLREQGLVE